MSYEPILRVHIKDVNKRLGIAERRIVTLQRRVEELRKVVGVLVKESLEEPEPKKTR